MTVLDDGSGPAIYAGGEFTNAGGVMAKHIAKWVGNSRSPLGSNVGDEDCTLTVLGDGDGRWFQAGDYFTTAGGAPARAQ